MPQVFLTKIVQTTVCGEHAYHVECSCGFTTRRFAREKTALNHALKHAETHEGDTA